MAKECLVCGKSMGAFTSKIAVSDGHVCYDCWVKAGMGITPSAFMTGEQYTGKLISQIIDTKERNKELLKRFSPTRKVEMLSFDDDLQVFVITKSKKNKDAYYYSQIVDYELLEDGETITKGGLGRAVAGGVLFGGIGAIVGGVTGSKKTKGVCQSLQIKITFRNSPKQTEYLQFLSAETKKNSIVYKAAYQSAQNTISAIQVAADMVDNTSNADITSRQIMSEADEIIKFKKLLDDGIITQEEFEAKKRQLLGL